MDDTLAALVLVLVLIDWSLICILAGRIYETRRRLTEDMDARDRWANDYLTREEAPHDRD